MLKRFRSYIESQCLLKGSEKLLLGLSGGADSMLLLDLLLEFNYHVEAAHCNFQLRGDESEQDEAFVKKECEKRGVKLHNKRFNVSIESGSTQMVARKLRYEWFEDLRKSHQLDFILVASHLDDRFETALMNLIRVTGPAGIRNMRPIKGKLLRPFLAFSKEEILRTIKERQVSYRDDSSNAKTDYLRNLLRLELIPKLKELNPSLLHSYERSAEIMEAYEKVAKEACDTYLNRHMIIVEKGRILQKEHIRSFSSPSLLLLSWLSSYGFNYDQIQDIVSRLDETESRQFLAEDWTLEIDREQILLRKQQVIKSDSELVEEVPFRSRSYAVQLEVLPLPKDLKQPNILFIDLEKLNFPLTLRAWKAGDRIQALGMSGSKKLSDLFTDMKITNHQKQNCPVLLNDDEICCIPGIAISDKYKVSDKTRNVLAIKLDPAAS